MKTNLIDSIKAGKTVVVMDSQHRLLVALSFATRLVILALLLYSFFNNLYYPIGFSIILFSWLMFGDNLMVRLCSNRVRVVLNKTNYILLEYAGFSRRPTNTVDLGSGEELQLDYMQHSEETVAVLKHNGVEWILTK